MRPGFIFLLVPAHRSRVGLRSFVPVEAALLAAILAVAAYFRAGQCDLDAAIVFDLFLQFFVELRLEFADLAAFQTGYMDVVAGAVAFVEVLVAAQVQEIKFVDKAVALE